MWLGSFNKRIPFALAGASEATALVDIAKSIKLADGSSVGDKLQHKKGELNNQLATKSECGKT